MEEDRARREEVEEEDGEPVDPPGEDSIEVSRDSGNAENTG
jgi:hypothetical protein